MYIRRFLNGVEVVSEWSGKVVSFLVIVMGAVLIYEVFQRYLFNSPTFWAHEFSQHLFGAYSVLLGAYVLLHQGHVRVEVICSILPSRWRAIVDSFTSLLFFLFVGVMLVYGLRIAVYSISIREYSFSPWRPPIYPLKLTIPIGAVLILFQGLADFIRSLIRATMGKDLA